MTGIDSVRHDPVLLDRRNFLRITGASGIALLVGPGCATGKAELANAFVRLGKDGVTTVIVKHLEMGQGVLTGLATLVAEELDADWTKLKTEAAPADLATYGNLAWDGASQGTGGSSSIANSWLQLREAGALLRALLIKAAAAQWKVPEAELATNKGHILHSLTGRKAGYGAFVADAAKLPLPKKVQLKSAADFKYIGQDMPRLDAVAKSSGRQSYTIDFEADGLLVAAVRLPSHFGATVKTVDSKAALAVPGVVKVAEVPNGVAVIAQSTAAALKGREALSVEWELKAAETRGRAELMQAHRQAALGKGVIKTAKGVQSERANSISQRIMAEFEFPYLAHAAMEPMNAVARITGSEAELWYPVQDMTVDQKNVADFLKIAPEAIKIHTLAAGGSFGRRFSTTADYVVQAVAAAKAAGDGQSVKMIWTREDDFKAGHYRPMAFHRIDAALGADGKIAWWDQRIAIQSIQPSDDPTEAQGADVGGTAPEQYAIANHRVSWHPVKTKVPVLYWRSVEHSHTAFSKEVMMDELARRAGIDPVAFRLRHLPEKSRLRDVLSTVAEKAGWASPSAKGRFRGVAMQEAFKTAIAMVAEISGKSASDFVVERVVAVVDCGTVVNPGVARSQIEGGMGYGLCAALLGQVDIQAGAPVPASFADYPVLRASQYPRNVEVHFIESDAPPTGVGELGVPPIGPAVANALFAMTGEPVRRLPLMKV
ncbi:MAG: molybdopterin cofactor-binding domain-containing protein [Sphingorhabdus sp.]